MGVMTHTNDYAKGFTEFEMGLGSHPHSSVYHTSLEMGLMTHFKLAYKLQSTSTWDWAPMAKWICF